MTVSFSASDKRADYIVEQITLGNHADARRMLRTSNKVTIVQWVLRMQQHGFPNTVIQSKITNALNQED